MSRRPLVGQCDFRPVISELVGKGYNLQKISTALGCSRCAVQNWNEGGEPGYAYGKALLVLHGEVCGNGGNGSN